MGEKTMCIIMLTLACISILVYLLYRVKKDGLRAITIELIVYAENVFQKGRNREKMDYVISSLISILPIWVRFFITSNAVEKFIQHIFDEIKQALDYTGGQG